MSRRNSTLLRYLITLKRNGFDVYITENSFRKTTWAFFVKNNKIGYVQAESLCFGCLSFSSVHKPCRHAGTGFRVHSEVNNPTIQNAINTIDFYAFSGQHVDKYTSWEEYMNYPTNNIVKKRKI